MRRRKKYERFVFTVEGSGQFPFDMLRYDCCYPYSEVYDSNTMAAEYYGQRLARRRVTLVTTAEHSPTPGRWQSFMWRVVGPGELLGFPIQEFICTMLGQIKRAASSI